MPPFIVIGWSIMSLKQQTKNFQTTEYSFIARNLVSLFHYVKWKLCAFVRKFCVSNSGCSINLRGAINLIDQIGFPLVSYLHIWKINFLLVYHLRVVYKSVVWQIVFISSISDQLITFWSFLYWVFLWIIYNSLSSCIRRSALPDWAFIQTKIHFLRFHSSPNS